jgi:hypothetical protein
MAVQRVLQTAQVLARATTVRQRAYHILSARTEDSKTKKIGHSRGSTMSADKREDRLVWVDLEVSCQFFRSLNLNFNL